MKRTLLAAWVMLLGAGFVQAHGLLIPEDKSVPPLAMLNHHVDVTLEDQVAVTKVTQSFRNHTDRQLEATYVFPVPRGANVKEFAMWVNGKRVKGELVEAKEARNIYNSIVRQTRDPGLLEYIGSDLLQLRVFPVPPKGDQKVELSFTSIAKRDHNLVEYSYPLKTNGKTTQTLEEFAMKLTLKSKQSIGNVYSPTHSIELKRTNDHEVLISFEKEQALLNKDFQLYYTTSDKDVGLTTIQHRPVATEDGYVLLMLSPRAELAKEQQVPRDLVFVVDTSGSMREDEKMAQAQKAVNQCLEGLSEKDRFDVISFATTVNKYRERMTDVNNDSIANAKKWVGELEASGGTAIDSALKEALKLRSDDPGRTFTIVFFTDGQPTIGETDTDKILASLAAENTTNTRIFTMGVGYDLNAVFLDQVAERTRAASMYVKPEDALAQKVTSFFGKITHPVLANLNLEIGEGVRLVDAYPPKLPDLFHGDQLILLARYQGDGHKAITLKGTVGMETKRFVYETDFQSKSEDKPFVEELWARRKVGYLLDQIRINGEKKELVAEVTTLAKKYGITTPYTSYLVMPDAPVPVAAPRGGAGAARPDVSFEPAALAPEAPGKDGKSVEEFARLAQTEKGELVTNRGRFQDNEIQKLEAEGEKLSESRRKLLSSLDSKKVLDLAKRNYDQGKWRANQIQAQGVNYAACTNDLKYQSQLVPKALRNVASRNCMEIGGVWIDEDFTAKTETVKVKAQSDAYFRMLERHPKMKEVFQLGNHLVWMAPNGQALVIDAKAGQEKLSDEAIDALFMAKK